MEDRKVYIDKMAAKLKEWDEKIQKLETKLNSAGAGAKVEFRQQITELRSKREEAQQKLKKLQASSEGSWEELKAGIEKSTKIFGDSVKKSWDKLK